MAPPYDWSADVFAALRKRSIATVATIPDGGLTRLLEMCDRDDTTRVVTLSTEEEGVAICAGVWLGGGRAMLAMQSSGVGNCINAFGYAQTLRSPLVMLITMRGQWGEFNPWQVPMGKAVEPVMSAMGVNCYHVDTPDRVGETFAAAADLALNGGFATAVLVSQRIIGTKGFGQDD